MKNKTIKLENNSNVLPIAAADVKTLVKIFNNNKKLIDNVENDYIEGEMYYINDIMEEIRAAGAAYNWSIGFYNHNYINIKDGGAFLEALENIQKNYCLLDDVDADLLKEAIKLNDRLYWFDRDNKQYKNLENKVNYLIELLEEIFIKHINYMTIIDNEYLEDYFLNCYYDKLNNNYFYNINTFELLENVNYIKSYK